MRATTPVLISVLLTGGGAAHGAISASPTALSFAYQMGGSAPAPQTLSISSGLPATAFTATTMGSSWIIVDPTSGTTPATLTVSVNPAALASAVTSETGLPFEPGTYGGDIFIAISGQSALGIPITVNVSGTYTPPVNLAGTWKLTAGYSTTNPTFTATVQLLQNGAALSGQFTFSGNPCAATALFSGTLETLSAPPVGLVLEVDENGQTVQFLGVISADGNSITGTYSGEGGTCVGRTQGNWIAARGASISITPSTNSLTFSYQIGGAVPPTQIVKLAGSSPVAFTIVTSGGSWLSATPNQGTTPATLTVSANPAGLGLGNNSGLITVTAPGAANSPQTIAVGLVVAADPVSVTSVMNAASSGTGAIAPGEIVEIRGVGLGPAVGLSYSIDPTTGKVDTTLAGTQVLFGGVAAPILYASASQINAIVPYEIGGQSQLIMQVHYQGVVSTGTTLQVSPAAPGIFTLNASGSGEAIAINDDGSLNGPANPAHGGSYLTIYFTGGGQTTPAGSTGSVSGLILKYLTQNVTATVGGQPAPVTFAGAAPTFVDGVGQLNILLAVGTPSGPAQPLVVTIGGSSSPTTAKVAIF